MTPIPEIVVDEVVPVKGRGDIYVCSQSKNPDVNLSQLMRKWVRVNGIAYVVTSVEMSEKNGLLADGVGLILKPLMDT